MKIIITDDEQKRRAIDAVMRCNLDKPMMLELTLHKPKRTLSANALYWQWLTVMAKHFNRKAGPFSQDDMHDLMKHKFLGYDDARRVGNTEIPAQLKSTAKLDKGEMSHFMGQIDAWAADHGCLLPRPEDNEYDQWARMQNG